MRNNRKTNNPHEGGFTLLETLVALVITSISLVIVLQSFSSSFRTRALTQQTYDMAQLAESKLDELEVITQYPPADASGQVNDTYDWSVTFRPYEDTQAEDIEVFWMEVTVLRSDGADKGFRLERLVMFDLRDQP